jgi:hypothetical protein
MSSHGCAFVFSAALIGCAAAPVAAQSFEFSHEIDADILAVLGESEGVRDGLHTDFRLRTHAEAISQAGLRWGGAFALAARTRDGRRGLQSNSGSPFGPAGLVTGLGGAGGKTSSVVALERAELFVRGAVFEVYAGVGPSAVRRERLRLPSALRLTSADGALVDPLGQGLVSTALTLSAPSPQLTVKTRRLAGFSVAASYAPSGDVCGPDRCLDVRYGEVDQIVSAVVSFDRRSPSSRARWSALAGFEAGQSVAGPLSAQLEDPWVVTAQLAREAQGVTLSVEAVHAQEGPAGTEYSAGSGSISVEAGDWLYSAELGRGFSDLAGDARWTAQLGASRFVGARGVAAAALQVHDGGGTGLLLETGLRF